MDRKFSKKNRKGRKGGGIVLIYRLTLNIELIEQQQNSDLIKFLDVIAEYLALHINTKYPIFLGDFNIHWGDELDGNASSFADTLEALGLTQHYNFQHTIETISYIW